MIRACDGHRGHGEGGCGFRSSGLREADGDACPMCGGALVEMAPPVPRRPVAGWAEVYPGLWVLGDESALVRASIRAARALGDFWWGIDTPGVIGQRGGRAPTLEAAQLAAEDALLAVLTDAARVIGKRVVS